MAKKLMDLLSNTAFGQPHSTHNPHTRMLHEMPLQILTYFELV